jgi:hypothetical protein
MEEEQLRDHAHRDQKRRRKRQREASENCRPRVPAIKLYDPDPNPPVLAIDVEAGEEDGGGDELEGGEGKDGADAVEEGAVVLTADAGVQPLAVVVELVNALLAEAAVLRGGGHVDLADPAEGLPGTALAATVGVCEEVGLEVVVYGIDRTGLTAAVYPEEAKEVDEGA